MGKNEKVYSENNLAKSNTLIQSKYKTTVLGNKIIALGLYHLQRGDYTVSANGGNLVCELPAAEIRKRLGRSGNSLYRDLDDTSKRLLNYQLGYKDAEKQEFRYVALFTEMAYKDGTYRITFNGDMKAYLSELKENYTLLNLPLMLKWQKAYTFRLYEILSSRAYLYREQGYRCEAEFNLAEFKFMLGCYDIDDESVRTYIKGNSAPDYDRAEQILCDNQKAKSKEKKNKFISWTDFKKYILEPAIKEINSSEEADMIIDEVEPLKKGIGAKVYGIIFKYRVKLSEQENVDPVELESAATREPEIIQMTEDEKFDFEATVKNDILSQYKLQISDVRAICAAADYDMQKIVLANEVLKQQRGQIDSVVGWLISCIKEAYELTKKGPTNKFNGFEQRNYSDEELRKLEEYLLSTPVSH